MTNLDRYLQMYQKLPDVSQFEMGNVIGYMQQLQEGEEYVKEYMHGGRIVLSFECDYSKSCEKYWKPVNLEAHLSYMAKA